MKSIQVSISISIEGTTYNRIIIWVTNGVLHSRVFVFVLLSQNFLAGLDKDRI